METATSLVDTAQAIAREWLAAVIGYAPSILTAILVIFLGWLLARLARRLTRQVSLGTNQFLERTFQRGTFSQTRLTQGTISIVSEISFWIVLFLAATIAARVANLPTISGWLNQIVAYLPNLLVGAAIIVAGYFISIVVGENVEATARSTRSGHGKLMGRLAQGAVFVTALTIGLDQVGVDVGFLVALFAVSIGAIFVGFSLAFGLGARDYAANLIGARAAQRSLQAGAVIRIGEVEGQVLEITPTQIAIDTEGGRKLVPARLAEECGYLIMTGNASNTAASGKVDE